MTAKNKLRSGILLLLILVMVVPYFCITFYTFPFADDYSMANERREYFAQGGSWIASCFSQMIYSTANYGYGFGHFWNFLLSPIYREGLTKLHAILLSFQILFVISLGAFSSTIIHRCFGRKRFSIESLALMATLTALFFGMRFYPEIYFWFTTAEFYLFNISLGLLSVALLVEYISCGRRALLVLSTLLAFLSACGPTNLDTMLCFGLLFSALYGFLGKKRGWSVAIPLLTAVAVTLAYLCFPGAIGRMGDRALDFIGAAGISVKDVAIRFGKLCIRSYFPVVLAAFAVFAWKCLPLKSNSRFWDHPILMLPALALVCIIITYPVALGYASYYPNRSEFMTDASLYFSGLFYTLYLVQFLRRKPAVVKRQQIAVRALCVLCAVFVVGSALLITPILEQPTFAAYDELLSGRLKSNADYWGNYLDSLPAQKGMDVETPLPDDLTSHFIVYYQLLPDPTHWANEALAQYYGLNSIRQDTHCGQFTIR